MAVTASAYLFDGYPTVVVLNSGVTFYERSVEPVGYTGGGPIDITTMHNALVRTAQPKSLLTVTQTTVKTAYELIDLVNMIDNLLLNQPVNHFYPTNDRTTFFGWLEELKPEALEEGKLPIADVKFEASNLDPETLMETAPVTVPAP